MPLSSQTIVDKNALATNAVFLVLLEINIPNVPIIRIVNNTEDITWNGFLWQQFPFDISDISQTTKSEVPQITVKISNTNRVIERYLQDYDFYLKKNGIDGNDIKCTIRVINTNDIANTTPITKVEALLQQPTTTPQWATFKLSANNSFNKTFPIREIRKSFCSWKFKSEECGYSGTGGFCDKTLTMCDAYSNTQRFGGFIGVAGRGVVLV